MEALILLVVCFASWPMGKKVLYHYGKSRWLTNVIVEVMDENAHTECKIPKKQKRCPDTWKDNIWKKAINSGEEYLSKNGKFVPAKMHLGVNCCKTEYALFIIKYKYKDVMSLMKLYLLHIKTFILIWNQKALLRTR